MWNANLYDLPLNPKYDKYLVISLWNCVTKSFPNLTRWCLTDDEFKWGKKKTKSKSKQLINYSLYNVTENPFNLFRCESFIISIYTLCELFYVNPGVISRRQFSLALSVSRSGVAISFFFLAMLMNAIDFVRLLTYSIWNIGKMSY